jgi:hypothetical protein
MLNHRWMPKLAIVALALPLLTTAASPPEEPKQAVVADDWAPPGGRIGYVLWDEYWGIRETPGGKEECPDGWNIGPREQFAILYPDKGKKRKLVDTQLAYESQVWFPDTTPDKFEYHEATGKYALGIDLDGKSSPEDFVSDDGRTGIDNQLFRVVGCVRNYRKEGELGIITTKWRQQNRFNRVVFELSNVDSLKNDPEVTVSYYRTLDHLLADSTGHFLPGGSQRVDTRFGKRFQTATKGRIVDGVLETDPIDLQLPELALSDPSIIFFKGMKLRLTLTPEKAEGVLGGYADIEQWYYAMNTSWATHHASYGQASAPSIYRALRRLADGYPDPKTGHFTAISAAMDIKLVQVYVIHPEPESLISKR